MLKRISLLPLLLVLNLFALALAHQVRLIGTEGGEQYKVIVGQLNEPVFTDLRSGLDLIVQHVADGAPVEGLENSLMATLTAPDGQVRTLTVVARHGAPGSYKDDYVATVAGTYIIRITGFIGTVEIDESFEAEVRDVRDIRFP